MLLKRQELLEFKSPLSDQQSNSNLNQRCQDFVSLYTSSYHSIYSFTLSLVASTEIADDIMQETGLLLWQKFDDFAPGTNFEGWARAFVRNLVRNFHRTHQPAFLSFDDDLLGKIAATHTAAQEWLDIRRSALQKCMSILQQSERNYIRLCYEENNSIVAAASELSETLNAVYKKLRRIRGKLFRCIEKRLGMEE